MKVIYPGTFDPVTFGHLDVIKRGVKLFGSITIGVAENPGKKPLFSLRERVEMLKESLDGMKNVEIKSFDSLLVDFAKTEKASVVLRGLRETSDFPTEFQHAIVNRVLDPGIETVFVMTSEKNFYVTSSIVKEIASHKGSLKEFVPKPVQERLEKKFG
ncbi:MAG TPA: pantetheine-phosphate adenylyltransferase [archaeon]|nr:pantetheine-phosphate adenylyltransferase [archaeon]